MTKRASSLTDDIIVDFEVRLRLLEKMEARMEMLVSKLDYAVQTARRALEIAESLSIQGAQQGDPFSMDDFSMLAGGAPFNVPIEKDLPPRTELPKKDVPSGNLDELAEQAKLMREKRGLEN